MTVPQPPQTENDPEHDGRQVSSLRDLFASIASISAVSSLHELLPHLAGLLACSVGAQRCSVFLFDRDMTRVVDHLRWGYSDDELSSLEQTNVKIEPRQNPAIQHVARSGAVLLRTPDDTPPHLQPTAVHDRGMRWPGDMVVPFIWNGHFEGCAYILLPEGAERFDPLQAEIAQTVAHQAAGIINHLRAAEAERRAHWQTGRLLDLSRTLNEAATMAEIYEALADAIHTVMELDAVSAVVREATILASGTFVNRRIAAIGMTDDERSIRDAVLEEHSALDSTIDVLVGRSNEPLVVGALETHVDDARLRASLSDHEVDELLAIPVVASGELHGMVYGWCRQGGINADEDQMRIAGIMARHASVSVERLLLVDSVRHLLHRTETMASVHRDCAFADDPLTLVQVATGGIRQVLDADFATTIVHGTAGLLHQSLVNDGATEADIERVTPFLNSDPGRWLSGTDSPPGAQVVRAEQLHIEWPVDIDSEEGPCPPLRVIEVPLVVRGQRTGTTHAWFRDLNTTVRESDLESAADIARDVARAIERVTLQASERQQWDRAEMLRSFSEALNRSIEMPAVIRSIHEAIRMHLPDVEATIATCDEVSKRWVLGSPLSHGSRQVLRVLMDVEEHVESKRQPVTTEVDGQVHLVVPLIAGVELVGALVISRPGSESLSENDDAVVSSLAPQAADAIQRARLYAVSERTIAEMTLLDDVGRSIAQLHHLPDILEHMSEAIRKLVNYSIGIVALEGAERDYLQVVSVWGDPSHVGVGALVPVDASIPGSVYLSQEPVVVDNVRDHPSAWEKDTATWQSIVCVPLMTGSRAIGALLLGHDDEDMFTSEDLRLASLLAGQAGAAIYHARESERRRELYRAGVEALAAAVDAKDSYIHSHSRQVAELSRRTAEVLGLDAEEVERIELAGLLHDVGKIGIPDHILVKPDRLDAQERLVMISHATLGERIVAAHPALADMANIIRHHHEWHNGSGYPDGLRGDEVPIGAAIIGVADAYDSMTTYRPYRDALPYDAARDELTAWRGIQFHPRVVDAFLSWIEEGDIPSTLGAGSGMALQPIQAIDIVGPRVMSKVAVEIDKLTDLYPFLDRLQQIISDELKYEEVNIFLVDEAGEQLVLGASTINAGIAGRLRISIGEGIAGQAARLREAVSCQDVEEDPRAGYVDIGLRSVIAIPMIVGDRLIGVLGAGSMEPHRFEGRDEKLLAIIGEQIAPTVMVSQLHDHTRLAATTDGLTGVMNHRAFYHRLESMIVDLDHWDDDLHLLIVDVIGLKAINDVHGHLAGDRALIAVANALKQRVRGEDEIARYGGDEFVVIVRGTPRAGLDELVQRIITPVAFALDDGYQLSVRLRCGVATAHSSAERATELVARADAGLYAEVQPTKRSVE